MFSFEITFKSTVDGTGQTISVTYHIVRYGNMFSCIFIENLTLHISGVYSYKTAYGYCLSICLYKIFVV